MKTVWAIKLVNNYSKPVSYQWTGALVIEDAYEWSYHRSVVLATAMYPDFEVAVMKRRDIDWVEAGTEHGEIEHVDYVTFQDA